MKSKKSHENYMLIDHTASPGIEMTPEYEAFLRTINPEIDLSLLVPGGKKLEIGFYTCSHCHTEVIKNPERTRARGYCPKCDHYICDRCDGIMKTEGCQTIAKVIDNMLEKAERSSNILEL